MLLDLYQATYAPTAPSGAPGTSATLLVCSGSVGSRELSALASPTLTGVGSDGLLMMAASFTNVDRSSSSFTLVHPNRSRLVFDALAAAQRCDGAQSDPEVH